MGILMMVGAVILIAILAVVYFWLNKFMKK
jgi:hypothetical protein